MSILPEEIKVGDEVAFSSVYGHGRGKVLTIATEHKYKKFTEEGAYIKCHDSNAFWIPIIDIRKEIK
jgi:hypothetical protein